MLKQMAERGERASQGGDRRSKSQPATLKLDDLGLTRDRSSRWQSVARLSDGEFQAVLDAVFAMDPDADVAVTDGR